MFVRNVDDTWRSEIADKRSRERRAIDISRPSTLLPILRTHALFTLAPVYVYAGVSYSVPDQFEIEAGQQGRLIIDCQREMIAGLKTWGRYVEAMPLDAWDSFSHYVMTSGFFSKTANSAWFVYSTVLRFEDLGSSVMLPDARLPVPVYVFLPTGNKAKLVVTSGAPAVLRWVEPDKSVKFAAELLLSKQGRIDRNG